MSKLSYLGKGSEPRENARARGKERANCISLRLGEGQMKFYETSLQALLSSAPRGFAARSRVLARLVSLTQIGELARRLSLGLHASRHYKWIYGALTIFNGFCCIFNNCHFDTCTISKNNFFGPSGLSLV